MHSAPFPLHPAIGHRGPAPEEVHLWFAQPGTSYAGWHARYASLLAPEEAARHARFLAEKDRDAYLVARALVRCALSTYADVEPHAWRFVANARGRPRIAGPLAPGHALRFNLSHTDTLVALAVTRGRLVGVDIEAPGREAPLDVAQRFFAAPEIAALQGLPSAEQAGRFWELWTLKESYLKARGMGLAIPLDTFAFGFPSQRAIRFGSLRPPARPDRWRLVCRNMVPLERQWPASLRLLRDSGDAAGPP
jgi:4'-phosphopantetheinyl transferase